MIDEVRLVAQATQKAQDLMIDLVQKDGAVPFNYKDKFSVSIDRGRTNAAIKGFLFCVANILACTYKNSHEHEYLEGKEMTMEFLSNVLDSMREETREEVR